MDIRKKAPSDQGSSIGPGDRELGKGQFRKRKRNRHWLPPSHQKQEETALNEPFHDSSEEHDKLPQPWETTKTSRPWFA
jgi:hypothetical protein